MEVQHLQCNAMQYNATRVLEIGGSKFVVLCCWAREVGIGVAKWLME